MMSSEHSKINQITKGVIWKQLLIFFFPIAVGTIFQQLYNIADTVIVGRFIGKQTLESVGGSVAALTYMIISFFTGLTSGATQAILSMYLSRFLPEHFVESATWYFQLYLHWEESVCSDFHGFCSSPEHTMKFLW